MKHSLIGGSTVKIVMGCPGSLKLREKMPASPENSYMAEGTLCHKVIEHMLSGGSKESTLKMTYNRVKMTPELYDEKIQVALDLLDEIDPHKEMEYALEQRVSFSALPGVFGTCDLIGRIGDRAIVLDWKFGDGVIVEAEGNEQGLFYASAAMCELELNWVFDGAKELEIIIVQPPEVRRWVTSLISCDNFTRALVKAVQLAESPNAWTQVGEHCRICSAKPICPEMTGALDRIEYGKLTDLDAEGIALRLTQIDALEGYANDLKSLASTMLEKGIAVPGWKMVAKRGTRKWANPAQAEDKLTELGISPYAPKELLSPAQAEKELKKVKKNLPDGLTVVISSGDTLVPESDPRPAVLQIGKQLSAALSKI